MKLHLVDGTRALELKAIYQGIMVNTKAINSNVVVHMAATDMTDFENFLGGVGDILSSDSRIDQCKDMDDARMVIWQLLFEGIYDSDELFKDNTDIINFYIGVYEYILDIRYIFGNIKSVTLSKSNDLLFYA